MPDMQKGEGFEFLPVAMSTSTPTLRQCLPGPPAQALLDCLHSWLGSRIQAKLTSISAIMPPWLLRPPGVIAGSGGYV